MLTQGETDSMGLANSLILTQIVIVVLWYYFHVGCYKCDDPAVSVARCTDLFIHKEKNPCSQKVHACHLGG